MSRRPGRRLAAAVAAGALALVSLGAFGASAVSAVTLEQIMAHPQWIGRPPLDPYWSWDGEAILFDRALPLTEDGLDLRDTELWRVGPAGPSPERIPPEELARVDGRAGVWSRDRSRRLFLRHGDLFLRDAVNGALRQLTRTNREETQPLFLEDGRVGFRRGTSLWAVDPNSGLSDQLFDLRLAASPEQEEHDERLEADHLARREPELFSWIEDLQERRRRTRERTEELRRKDSSRAAAPWFLGEKRELGAVALSPTARFALVATVDADALPPAQTRDQMPRYVTESGYVEAGPVRPKVGIPPETGQRLHLLDRHGHRLRTLDLSGLPTIRDDPLAELRAAAEEREARRRERLQEEARRTGLETSGGEETRGGSGTDEAEEGDGDGETAPRGDRGAEGDPPEPRPVLFSHLLFDPTGRRAVFQAFSLDNKDRWIAAVDLESGAVRPLHHLHDPAWINWRFRDLAWIDDRRLYFLSEESGWSQLYLLDAVSGVTRRLTEGDFVVDEPELSPDRDAIYYVANAIHPSDYDVWRVGLDGGAAEKITAVGGLTSFRLSPDGEHLALLHSTMVRPPELFLQPTRGDAEARRLTGSTTEAFDAVDWTDPRIVEVPSRNVDRPIVSRLYLPEDSPPSVRRSDRAPDAGGRPAVLFVHGAGYLQNAHQGWSGYFREFMFHTLLTERGYVVLDMDYRGSAGYGRDWRTAIYRHMGGPEVEDLEDGVRWLVETQGVDRDRIGVYGGSYGGFLTFMSMFTQPELFAAGAALRPVTDWAHYNHPYTSNILNTPRLDPEAYARSSPIHFAEGLERPLLILSPMLDDNVLFQDSVRLVQRLIELEKEDWWIHIYPVEPHGFLEPSSWLDEYRRILRLFEEHVRPAGPRP